MTNLKGGKPEQWIVLKDGISKIEMPFFYIFYTYTS